MEKHSKVFKKAEKLVDMEKSGNPDQKYQPGSIRSFAKKAEESGKYKPYIEDVIETTKDRFPELEKKIEETEGKSATVSLEHTNPKEYKRQKAEQEEEERIEEIKELKNKINNSLENK